MDIEPRPDSAEGFRQQQHEVLALFEDQSWVLHTANLDADGSGTTQTGEKPFSLLTRHKALQDQVTVLIPIPLLDLPERMLTPRHPYQDSPLSYLNASGRSWSLFAENRKLEWAEGNDPQRRYGGIQFWFRNVEPGSRALITLKADIGTTAAGITGSIAVRSSDAPPRSFPVTGTASHTFDLVASATDPFATLVTAEVGTGVGYFAFTSIAYRKI